MGTSDDYRSLVRRLASMPFTDWAARFAVTDRDPWLDGSFGLLRGSRDWDLYALVDMLLCAATLEPSQPTMRRIDPQAWADRIRSCLDKDGLATRRNPTDQVPEHATAYAYTGLVLLRARGARFELPPFRYFKAPSFSRPEFEAWFRRMGFRFPGWVPGRGLRGSLRASARRLGWFNFWPGSHVVGGVLATMIMREQLRDPDGRAPQVEDVPELAAFLELADAELDPGTGFWRPWFRRLVSRHPTVGDVGGAAHFLWLYDRLGVHHAHAEPMLRNALRLQRADGLFAARPSCLELDFAHLFAYAARIGARPDLEEVDRAMLHTGIAVLEHVLDRDRLDAYGDSHGLPGALCAVAQVDAYLRWRGLETGPSPTSNVLGEACWI